MKTTLFRLSMVCLPVFAMAIFADAVMAQSGLPPGLNVRYSVLWLPSPIETVSTYVHNLSVKTDVDGQPIYALVVGSYNRTDKIGSRGFIYDQFGYIDPTNPMTPRFYDIEDLINQGGQGVYPPVWAPTYTNFNCVGVNSGGMVTGMLHDPITGDRKAYYLDLNVELKLKEIPQPPNALEGFNAIGVNEFDEILVKYSLPGGPPWIARCAIYDSIGGTLGNEIPIDFDNGEIPDFNDLRQVVGTRIDGIGVRYNRDGSIDEFPELAGINNLGQMTGTLAVTKGKNKGGYAFRYDIAGNEEWRAGTKDSVGRAINLAGDILGDISNENEFLFHDDWGVLNIVELVLAESDPNGDFNDGANLQNMRLSDRDLSGFGWIAGRVYIVPPGETDSQWQPFLLVPIVPGPTPGISISPTSGLVTTEAGGQDSFDVVLDTAPVANVSIGISSSDPTEGTTGVSSLTFTSANWNQPQTVTAAGVDDLNVDGDIAYTITTAASTSIDPDYNGLDADDVGVTNLDDEQAPTVTYNSTDLPLAIPDNDPDGIDPPFTILVTDDFQIADLTVTLDISHQRPSDLDVYLIGPNNSQVQLFTFSGDNNVSNFNGTSTLDLWTVEVYDTRKKKEGTLNGWSMTVEY